MTYCTTPEMAVDVAALPIVRCRTRRLNPKAHHSTGRPRCARVPGGRSPGACWLLGCCAGLTAITEIPHACQDRGRQHRRGWLEILLRRLVLISRGAVVHSVEHGPAGAAVAVAEGMDGLELGMGDCGLQQRRVILASEVCDQIIRFTCGLLHRALTRLGIA